MDHEFSLVRKVSGVATRYSGFVEVRVDRNAKWKWEIGDVMVYRRIGRGWHLIHADAELASWIRREVSLKHRGEITTRWRRCQEGGDTPREFSEFVRSVV